MKKYFNFVFKRSLHDLDDAELVSLAVDGDDQAFTVLYERHSAGLYRFVFRLILNEEKCKEVVQESWLKAFKYLDTWNGKASVRTWIWSIGKNTAIDYLRKKSEVVFEDPEQVESFSVEDEEVLASMIKESQKEEIYKTLSLLSTDQRIALGLWMEGMAIKEISEFLERSPQASKNLIHRAKKRMSELLRGVSHD